MQKIAIIGAGVSGMSAAHFLKDRYNVTVFEKEKTPGGLIKCCRINGSLFHTCGGHVFNSKHSDVLDWFWTKFDPVSYTHLRAHETGRNLVCRLLLEKKKKTKKNNKKKNKKKKNKMNS